jgi:hypothetical protein
MELNLAENTELKCNTKTTAEVKVKVKETEKEDIIEKSVNNYACLVNGDTCLIFYSFLVNNYMYVCLVNGCVDKISCNYYRERSYACQNLLYVLLHIIQGHDYLSLFFHCPWFLGFHF